jgi:hypothetical protein
VKAIIAGAALASGNSKSLDDLQEMLKHYTDLMYPEQAHELEDKKAKIARIMEREFAQGPMKVQAQDYDKKRRKKQWRSGKIK